MVSAHMNKTIDRGLRKFVENRLERGAGKPRGTIAPINDIPHLCNERDVDLVPPLGHPPVQLCFVLSSTVVSMPYRHPKLGMPPLRSREDSIHAASKTLLLRGS